MAREESRRRKGRGERRGVSAGELIGRGGMALVRRLDAKHSAARQDRVAT